MKQIILLAFSFLIIGSVVFISCKSKNKSDSITPGYKGEVGTGSNPSPGVTTTGTVNSNPIPNQSSMMTVGGGSWNTPGCVPGQLTLTGSNSSTGASVTLYFSSPPTNGAYTTISTNTPGAGQVYILVTNPTGQPAGTQWGSLAGKLVQVVINGGTITASFTGIGCAQVGSTGALVTVTISGSTGCI